MVFPVYETVFYFFASVLVLASLFVITSRNPVHAILFLVLSFFSTSVLWMLLQAEFLSLVLIFVYVGAVMTLFLFVVMMLNIQLSTIKHQFVRYLPVALLVMLLLAGTIITVLYATHHFDAHAASIHFSADYNNTKSLGVELFTHYLFEFEIAGAILLVAIISAISLAFNGKKPGTHSQSVADQIRVTKSDRLSLVDIEVNKE